MDPVEFVKNSLGLIWNQKMVGAIYDTFTHTAQVHRSCRDDIYGHDAIMVEVVEQLAAIPDLYLHIEDVIWSGDDEGGYRVSISLKITGHNLGVSRYGTATQREIQQSLLMNAHIYGGRFIEVWIADDERSLVEQLGFNLQDAMRSLEALDAHIGQPITEELGSSVGEIPAWQNTRPSVDKLITIELKDEAAIETVLSALWNGRQVGLCEQFYAEDFTCHWASNQLLKGRADYQAVVLAQCAAFPDLIFYIDDVISQKRDDGWHVGLTWTMQGTHAGPSIYGKPSGKRVQIAGISQYVIQDGRFVSERTEWNEFRLMKNIMERTTAPPEDDSTDTMEESPDES